MKYKNTSGFKQIAILNGKKEIIGKDEVFETEREVFNPAFEKVSDTSEVTPKNRNNIRNPAFNEIQKQIEDVKKEVDLTKIEPIIDEKLRVFFKEEIEKRFEVVNKRLEILKSAVQTLELELENNLYGENSDKSTWGRVCCSSFGLVFGRFINLLLFSQFLIVSYRIL